MLVRAEGKIDDEGTCQTDLESYPLDAGTLGRWVWKTLTDLHWLWYEGWLFREHFGAGAAWMLARGPTPGGEWHLRLSAAAYARVAGLPPPADAAGIVRPDWQRRGRARPPAPLPWDGVGFCDWHIAATVDLELGDDLVVELDLGPVGSRRRVLRRLEEWREAGGPTPPSGPVAPLRIAHGDEDQRP